MKNCIIIYRQFRNKQKKTEKNCPIPLYNGMGEFDFKVKLSLVNNHNESFMGIGLVWLPDNIKKYHSINAAAKKMNMSYVKALKIVNRLEDNIGFKVINRKTGGDEHGGSEITLEGEEFIKKFNKLFNKVNKITAEQFDKIYNNHPDK